MALKACLYKEKFCKNKGMFSPFKKATKKIYPLLMTPGPVPVPDVIMQTVAEPIIHHRTDAFKDDFKSILKKLPQIFKTSEAAFVLTSTGSGAMEAALINTLSPGDKMICIVNGKFGERWVEIARAFHFQPIVLNVKWGKAFDIQSIENLLLKNPDAKAIACQAVETSTAVLNPVRELGEFLKSKSPILIVDAITALGATPLAMDDWGLDVVIGGAQKAFMLPTGISMLSFSKKAWKFVQTSTSPKYYFDIQNEKKANDKGQTFFSSPVTLLRALKTSLDFILDYGLDNFTQRHEVIAEAFRESGRALGLEVFSQSPAPTVTAFLLPHGIHSEEVQKIMEEQFYITVAGGQDALKDKIIRIGHMGAIEKEHILKTIHALSKTLELLGHKNNPSQAIEIANLKLKNLKPLAIK